MFCRAISNALALLVQFLTGQWVVFAHKLFELSVKYMGINLGRCDIGMAQKRLDGAKISPVLQEMRGEGMTQSVRRNSLGRDSCSNRQLLDKSKKPNSCQMPPLAP